MAAARWIAFGIVTFSAIFCLGKLLTIANLLINTPLNELKFRNSERLEATDLRIEDMREFLRIKSGGYTLHYYYVRVLRIKFKNLGSVSYKVDDLMKFDLFIVYSKNVGTNKKPELGSSSIRIPFRADCSDRVAPCWRVREVRQLIEPANTEKEELINVYDKNKKGAIDFYERFEIEVRLSESITRMTLMIEEKRKKIVGSDGWMYITLCTPYGHLSKPVNLYKYPWQERTDIPIG